MDDIMREAGLAKGSFYRYFINQEDLVEALMSPFAEDLLAVLATFTALGAKTSSAHLAQAQSMARELNDVLMTGRGQAQLYLQESRGAATRMRRPFLALRSRIITLLARATRGHGQGDDPSAVLALLGAFEGVLLEPVGPMWGDDRSGPARILRRWFGRAEALALACAPPRAHERGV